MKRMLSVVDASASEAAKCLTVEYCGVQLPVELKVLEPMRHLGKWFVSTDLEQLFGARLMPYHASLIGALAERFSAESGPALPVTVDMERLEVAIAGGSTVHDALADQCK